MTYNTEYINKTEAEEQGFVRTSRGILKLTAIEQLYYKGRLEFGDKRFCGEDRLRAASKLASDYEKSHFNSVSSCWKNDKVDQQQGQSLDIATEHFRNRYLTSVKFIPREFWSVVRKICIENQLPQPAENIPARRRTEIKYLLCWDLCRGLDRLIEHYRNSGIKF